MSTPNTLPVDYTLDEVSVSLRMSTRWIRDKVKVRPDLHTRRGHKILFTAEQVEKLRTLSDAKPVVEEPVTTGRKKRAS